jgi:hypothetical protein
VLRDAIDIFGQLLSEIFIVSNTQHETAISNRSRAGIGLFVMGEI